MGTTNLSIAERERVLRMARAAQLERRAPASSAIARIDRGSPVPLSFAQQRLWFLEQMGGLGSTFHVRLQRRLRGTLDRTALVRALERIVARHEALRTTFQHVDGVPEQRITPAEASRFHLAEYDLRGHAETQSELERLIAEETAAPFDLAEGPLIRGRLMRLADDDHVLLVTMHHLVSDGWSIGVLSRELTTLYTAFLRGEPDPLPPVAVQYADYAAWQRRWLSGEVLQAQTAFWQQALSGAPGLLTLPLDHPRPARMNHAGEQIHVALDEALTAGLKAFAQRHGATLFMVLLAGWSVVLSRLAGQSDVVIGTPTAGRNRREIEGLIGFFINTLPVRVDLSAAPTVAELLARVKERVLDAQRHQDIPFEQIVELVDPVRSLSHHPIFQVMFTWQHAQPGGGAALSLPGLHVDSLATRVEVRAECDLTLDLSEIGGRIVGRIWYFTSLFAPETAERYVRYLPLVLEAMIADERQRVDQLTFLPAAERSREIDTWNRTRAAYPRKSCLQALFEQQVTRAPDAAALIFEDECVTYAELNQRANQLAHHLRSLSVGPETRVAICLERGPEMVVALMAVLKAGGAYVPLDPAYPVERLAYMLADSAPAVVLTQGPVRERLTTLFEGLAGHVPVLEVDASVPAWASAKTTNPSRAGLSPAHPAYVIYTSGSTGRPKGVIVPHQGLCNVAVAQQRVFHVGPGDRLLQFFSFSFDAATFEVVMALASGAALCLAPRDALLPGPQLIALLRQHAVTMVSLPPSALAALPVEDLPTLRTISTAGEALPAELVARWSGRHRLLNLYGPTEATIWSTSAECTNPDALPDIGAPIANTRAYVLDINGEPAPLGVAGELLVGGVGVARGYLNRPDLTADRFVPDPFSGQPGARLYRTGDRVARRADGRLDFFGRVDQQVKIRGFRIELGEIEAKLAEHPAVQAAVVIAREDTPGETRLVAYVVSDAMPGADELRAHVSEMLPEHMVPTAYVRLDALPLTPNGKIDRKALPAPDADAYPAPEYEAPLGETEEALARIWSELLGVERVGRWDHFFELGGHSLMAITLSERMTQQGLRADVRTVFGAPTLAALAAAVSGERAEVEVPPNRIPKASAAITPEMLPLVTLTQAQIDAVVATVPGGAANVQDIYPLAPLQEGFLFHHLLGAEGEGDPYLKGAFLYFASRERLEEHLRALGAVIARHDVLRTAIAWDELPEPVQVVWRHAPLAVDEVDVSPDERDVAAYLHRRFDPRRHRLDLRRAPLMRGYFARDVVHDRWVLLLLHHHAVCDHLALGVLQSEIAAHVSGRAASLPEPLPFRNYVAQTRLGISQAEHRAFFTELLRDVDETTAPFGLLDVHRDGSGMDVAWLMVEEPLAGQLRERARALGVSAASLFHVALAQVVARTSGRDDVVFGTVLFGRMQAAESAARMMGLFINTLPIRIRVGDAGVEASVKETHAVLGKLLRHEHAPLALAQRCSGVPATAPLFTCVLNYRHSNQRPRPAPVASTAGPSRTLLSGERSNYPFDMAVDELGAVGFRLEAQVAPGVEARRVCALMYSSLESLVRALTDTPDRPLRQLSVLPASERRLVLEEWNRSQADFPRDVCLPDLFEAQVARTPDAVAVQSHDHALTYSELNVRANRLGHYLIELGVGPDTRVAVCTERSPDAIAAFMAVLKAGGAFVPLDPAAPAERMRSMLRDSAPVVVMVQADAHAARALAAEVAPGAPVLRLDADAVWAHQPAIDPRRTMRPAHLAYVAYTSGSTGTPKGVMVEHRSVCNHTLAVERAFDLTPGDRVLQFAPVPFDIAIEEIFGALTSGAALVLRDDHWLAGAGAFLERCEKNRITVMDLPTRFWKLLLDEGVAMPSCVRLLVIGGEAVELDALNVWFGRAGHRPRLFIASGPTETTIDSTMQEALDAGSASRALGRPMANSRAYLLDAAMEPVPVGVTGELYIGGVQVTRGYIGRPALTAERYVPNPFGDAGDRLYRTGDLGRWRGDGSIQFAGRADFQVKVRGFRVELGEIEARLRDHPDVHEAVVLAREDAAGDKRLVAYVVGGDGARPEVLRAHLDGMLPEYMVPAAYVRLQALPLTSTGKLDRKALPAPDSRLDEAGAYEAPIGETEHALAEIWSEVLSIDRVSRHDHFFELGGHSLMAVQVISRVQQRLMVDVDLGELFSQPTLKDFARKLETAPRAELPPIERESRPEHSPLSFAQQRLWFLEQLQDLGSTYHVPWRHRLRGTLDRSALKRALDRIVARHEALRTTFVQVEGVARQKIASPDAASFLLIEHDLTGLPDAPAELKRVTAEEFLAPFDLERGPLVRGRLVKLAADDHVLLVTMHHIVSDAWSTTVIAREMTALYDAFRRGEPDPLPALDVHYADYAAWQRRWVDGDRLQQQSNYWVETLAGASGLLQVPTDHPRPAAMDHVGAQLPVQLDPELTEALKALGRRHGTTLFMTLLTGWAIVLGRLSRQDDLVIGTPTANRGRPEIEPLIGFFVNTLALRVDLSGSPTVGELLGRVKARAIHAQRHQDIPFEKIVELVDPARSMSHTPLFQAMFAWQSEMPGDDLSFAGVRQGTMGSGSSQAPAKFDLSLSLRETGGRIAGALVYATALFERDTVTRHAGYLQFVLKQMAADDRQPVDRLAMLPESERALLVQQGNGPHADYPRASSVHGLFEAQVERTPAAEAVVFEETRLTYAELNARANRLAHHLIALGVGPDVRVGICVQRSLDMVVGMLAVLKAGGGYVPLDPSYPPDHLAYMMDDSAPVAILTHTHVRDRVANASVRLIELDTASPRWADRPSTNPGRRDVGAGHLAYMTYTSGSTGRPKGVFNPHGASLNRLSWMQERHGLRAGEGVLQNSAFSFDASVFEIFWPLTVGGRLIVPRPGAHHDPEYLVQLISGERVTTAYFVVSMLQLFLEYPGVERCAELTRVFCGGEALSTSLADRVREQLPRVRLHNMYGPTESAVSVSGEVLVLDEGVSSAPIGRPVPNVRVYLLDEWGEPVPMGVAGELHVAGVQLARGYHNRPELTAERFVADPFCGEPGARMYRTGDLARWRADGTIEFLGRVDLQVKMRGYRIEPGEIEARLVEHPSVREAAVLVREDTPGDVRLVAYWTGEELEAEILREHLSAMLPSYMVPSAYMRLEHLPLTPSGKLNRAALPAPVGLSTRSYQPPEGRSEQALARIWAEVLRAERVGRHDDFFALGGHSLLAVQVIARVREALKREATLGALFTWPVLKDFAQQLGTAARATLPPIEAAPRTGRIPLSFAQRRLWFLEQLGGLGSTYHLRRRLTFREELDRRALVSALDAMVARHESLRTTFAQVNGVPEQHIAPADIGFHLVEHDLRGRADAAAELRRLTIEEARAPFDLTLGPLARGRLIRIAADEHVLLLTVHHVISDGWSMGVFTRELRALYGAFRNSKPNPLPALPVQYADYAAWQQRWVAGEVIEQQADYWTRTLAGAPELLELPTDHPRPSRMHHAGAAFGVELDEALTAGLKALARRHGTTLFMTIMAGWATVLGRLSGQDDVVIGTPAAGRGRREIEGLIGFFVNTLALRFDLSGAPTVAELLKEVKARTLAAQEHQDIPFEQVVEVVAPARSLSHSPIFQAMFVWLDASWVGGGRSALARFEEGGEPGGASTESPDGQAQLEITLALSERAGRITGAVEYMTALFERETVERYVGYLRQVLETMVADDQQRVDRLRVLPERERVQVVEAWNDTDTVYPAEACIHDLFEAQVARTPNALAVTFGDRSLTYAELNARANRLAHHLGACGVEPEARVGLCMERSLEMVIGLLAVLKAGGAYVPLDPADPVGRVEAMLADCAPVVVLTQGALAERLNRVTVPILAVDADAAPWRDRPATNPPRAGLTPDHLAYIIYTSGSTGQPKGAMNAHRGVVNRLHWMQDAYGLGAGDAVPQKTPYTFDVSVWEFFWTLGVGARLVVARPEGHKDPAYLATLIHDAGITTMHFVPSMLQLFLDAADLALCTGLKRVVCSGEALPPALMARFHARLPGVALINLYGPTEAAVDVTEWPCEPGADTVSLGRPIANTRTYVLDGRFDPVPVGVIGELFIGGVQVARGYCNRPALTAERFVADPFGGTGARLYRTGDRVRWRANGTLEYVGRIDFQTKIRGVRIELGEIETRLAQHPAVREAVVLAREDTPGERRLVAYVVGDETAGADVLRAHLSETLPDYMVPAAYVRLGSLPLTASGKVDRRALPAPDSHAYARRGYEPPLGETEEVVARIWAEVLRIERVGRTDHFFELGGYSLLAVQMLARVREELGVNVPAGGVFAWPMLADFARELTSPSQVDLPPMEPVAQRGRIPLSFPQHRLWSLERNAGVGAARRVSMRFRMKGGLDQVALIAALEGIVARHEALRTTVVEVDGVPEQRIAPATTRFTLVEDDLRGEMNAQAELRRLLIEEARIPFDLAQGPLVRGRLIRTDEDDHVLAVTMHPMIADGWSTGIFAKELTARYGALHRGEPDPLSRPALQYADYALWQRRSVAGDALKAQAQYWKDTLEGAPEVLELPTDQPRPARPDYAGARVAVELDPTQTRELRALAHRHQVTVFMALLAGWGIVLHRLSGQDDVVIGSPTANRRRREIQGIIGAFENTLALRLNLSGKPTVGDLLAQVKARTVEAHLHQDIPFEEVVELVRPARSFSHTPVFQAMFLWRNAPTPEVAFPGLEVAPVTALEPPVAPESASQTAARFDLTLALAERGERIAGSLTYASALFERETVERHVGHLRHVLEAMAANDQLTADAFSLDAGDTRETARAGGHGRPVTIRAAGSQTPLFLVHEGTWSTAHAQVLEPHIGNDMPVYVLPAPSSAEAPARTIEEMATQLVRMIHEIRPGGPYRVAGWSSSGVLAYEIATQLLGEDEVVEFVGMFDGEFPGGPAGFGDVEGRRVLGDAVRGYIPQPIPAPVHRALSDVIARPRKIEKTPLAAADSFILKLQSGKRGVAPILCVPGAGTSITSYIDLSAVLDPSWPVYGLQPRGMDGTTVPHSTVSAAARHYLRAIEETWPDGPIHLLGHSFGGWIAFEIALRLRASGRSIGSLTIVDSEVPETDARSYDVDSALAFIKLVEVVELSAERSFGIARADVDAKDERGRLKLLHRKMVQHGLLNARSTDENVLYGPSRVFARCIRTVYRPSGRYPDRVRLVLANDPKLDEAANRDQLTNVVRGWKQWAPGLVVSTSTGNHVTALKAPHVATLGRYLVEDRSEVTIER